MYFALIKKELREVLPIAVVAGLALGVAVGTVVGNPFVNSLPFVHYAVDLVGMRDVPFAGSAFLDRLSSITFYFATVLAFRQTLGEDYRGTYLLLLHRPVPRRSTFAVKAFVGLSIYLLISSSSILALAWWAANPGNQPAPFFWSMTVPSWHLVSMMALVYLGAFLTGVREARWVGTRILPWFAATTFASKVDLATLPGLILFAVAILLTSAGIVWVTSQRDYA